MVIYWHGFVETILSVAEDDILITDVFPDEWVFPTDERMNGKED